MKKSLDLLGNWLSAYWRGGANAAYAEYVCKFAPTKYDGNLADKMPECSFRGGLLFSEDLGGVIGQV